MSVSIQSKNTVINPATPLAFVKLIDLADDIRNPGTFFEMLVFCEDVPYDIKVAFAVHVAEGLAEFIIPFLIGPTVNQIVREILTDHGFADFVEMADTVPATALEILNSGRRLLGFDKRPTDVESLPFATVTKEQVA